ncbi:hypothetical protein BH20ACT5_BH20ACT5_09380 [soil metagenome]
MIRRLGSTLLVLAALTGCSARAPETTVTVDGQTTTVAPAQYCLDGEPQVYSDEPDFTPPVLRVPAGKPIVIEVAEEVADSGWQVQVFDRDLAEQIGQVPVGTVRRFAEITTSDAEPAGYFLVIVQDAGPGCGGFAGAWPIGFVRDG